MKKLAIHVAAAGILAFAASQSGCASPANSVSSGSSNKTESSESRVTGNVYNLDCQDRCQVLIDSSGTTHTFFIDVARQLSLLEAALLSGQDATVEFEVVEPNGVKIVHRIAIDAIPRGTPDQSAFPDLVDVQALQFASDGNACTATFRRRTGRSEIQGHTENPLMISVLSFALSARLGLDYVTIDEKTQSITRVRLPTQLKNTDSPSE